MAEQNSRPSVSVAIPPVSYARALELRVSCGAELEEAHHIGLLLRDKVNDLHGGIGGDEEESMVTAAHVVCRLLKEARLKYDELVANLGMDGWKPAK